MNLVAERHDGVAILSPQGRIDHGSADAFRGAIEPWLAECHGKPGGVALVIDASHLEYISSAGLRVLMLASKQTKPAGGRIVVAAMPELVAEIFKISRFDMVFAVYPSVADARAALAS